MRVTTAMLYRTGLFELGASRERLARIQEQASTGRRINRPSDDPVGVRAAAVLKDGIEQTRGYQRTLDLARSRLDAADQALQRATEIMDDAAVKASAGVSGGASRAAIAKGVESLFDQLVKEANARVPGGGYVFAGTASGNAPFERAAGWPGWSAGGPAPSVSFVGDSSEIEVAIDEGIRLPVTLDGEAVFKTGPQDLFAVLGELRDALVADDTDRIIAVESRIREGSDHLKLENARVGTRGAQVERWSNRLTLQVQDLTQQLSLTEDADSIAVYSNLVRQETALNASLNVTSRLMQSSLLNFL